MRRTRSRSASFSWLLIALIAEIVSLALIVSRTQDCSVSHRKLSWISLARAQMRRRGVEILVPVASNGAGSVFFIRELCRLGVPVEDAAYLLGLTGAIGLVGSALVLSPALLLLETPTLHCSRSSPCRSLPRCSGAHAG